MVFERPKYDFSLFNYPGGWQARTGLGSIEDYGVGLASAGAQGRKGDLFVLSSALYDSTQTIDSSLALDELGMQYAGGIANPSKNLSYAVWYKVLDGSEGDLYSDSIGDARVRVKGTIDSDFSGGTPPYNVGLVILGPFADASIKVNKSVAAEAVETLTLTMDSSPSSTHDYSINIAGLAMARANGPRLKYLDDSDFAGNWTASPGDNSWWRVQTTTPNIASFLGWTGKTFVNAERDSAYQFVADIADSAGNRPDEAIGFMMEIQGRTDYNYYGLGGFDGVVHGSPLEDSDLNDVGTMPWVGTGEQRLIAANELISSITTDDASVYTNYGTGTAPAPSTIVHVTNKLRMKNFGLNVPDKAIIKGVNFTTYVGRAGTHSFHQERSIELVHNDSTISNSLPTTRWAPFFAGSDIYHGAYDSTYGAELTPEIVNDSSFGVDVQYQYTQPEGEGGGVLGTRLDFVELSIYYELPPTTTITEVITS